MTTEKNENRSGTTLPLGKLSAEEMNRLTRQVESDLNPDEWDQASKIWALIRTKDNSMIPCLLGASTDHPSDLIEEISDQLDHAVEGLRNTMGPLGPTEMTGFMLYTEGWTYSPEVQATMAGATMAEFSEFWRARPPKSLVGTDMAVEIKQLTCLTGNSSAIGTLTRRRNHEPEFRVDRYPKVGGMVVDSLRHLMHLPSVDDLTALSWLLATS